MSVPAREDDGQSPKDLHYNAWRRAGAPRAPTRPGSPARPGRSPTSRTSDGSRQAVASRSARRARAWRLRSRWRRAPAGRRRSTPRRERIPYVRKLHHFERQATALPSAREEAWRSLVAAVGLSEKVRFATDSPVEEAVLSELVSEAKFQNTGNFVRLGLRGRLLARNTGSKSTAYDPIPCASEQVISFALVGN
jgi:hypothetical protein